MMASLYVLSIYLWCISLVWGHRHHRCSSHHHTIIQGVNLFEQHIPYKNHPYEQPSDPSQRRALLSQSQVSPIRISSYYDPVTFTSALSASNQTYVKHLIGAVADYYANAVSVVPTSSPLHFDRRCNKTIGPYFLCAEFIPPYCGMPLPSEHLSEQYMFDDAGTRTLLPSGNGISDTDLVLFVTADDNTSYCNGTALAHAGPCFVDQFGRPIAGNMNICDLFWTEPTWQEDVEVLLHEMTHVTIMSHDLWNNFKNASGATISVNQVVDSTSSPHEIITPTVTAKVREHFNCPTATGLPLDVFGSAHWNERYAFSELMTWAQHSTQTYYTQFTLAFLEDSGWYLVNYDYAEPYAFGKDAGCTYFTDDCVDKTTHESNFPLYYCDGQDDGGCNADYSSPSFCYYGTIGPPPAYQYFAVSTDGGSPASDFCPWRTPTGNSAVCWDTTSAQIPQLPQFAEVWEATSRCATVKDAIGYAFGFCFDHICNGWNGSQYSEVIITVTSTETVSCTRSDASVMKTLSTISGDLQCPQIDIVCGTTSNFGACYWGYYSDNEQKCICSPGFTGADCNTINDGIIVDVTSPVSKPPTAAPTVEPEVCFQDWNDYNSLYNGVWSKTGENYGLGIYINPNNNELLSFKATEASWYIGNAVNPSTYFCFCRVSLYTDWIGDCSTNWVCWNSVAAQWYNYPQLKTYYGSCTFPAPTTPAPTSSPTSVPSVQPTDHPTLLPTSAPSKFPTQIPTESPSKYPTNFPTRSPTKIPSQHPTYSPSKPPTRIPTASPSQKPSSSPTIPGATRYPSTTPTVSPTKSPTSIPSVNPTRPPSSSTTKIPTYSPSDFPTGSPNTKAPTDPGATHHPSSPPSVSPSENPTTNPIDATSAPTISPTSAADPTRTPTAAWIPCVPRTELLNGDGHIEIMIDTENKKMKITMSGPTNQWFGVGFGSNVMKDTFAIVVNGDTLTERILSTHGAGQALNSAVDQEDITINVNSITVVNIVRSWALNGVNAYNFSDFFEGRQCADELAIIWALGNDAVFSNGHAQRDNSLSLRSCVCTDAPTNVPSVNPSHDPTQSPQDIAGIAYRIGPWFGMFLLCIAMLFL